MSTKRARSACMPSSSCPSWRQRDSSVGVTRYLAMIVIRAGVGVVIPLYEEL